MLAMGSCVCVCARTSARARSLRALTRHYTHPHTHLLSPRTGAVIACRLLMCLIVLDACLLPRRLWQRAAAAALNVPPLELAFAADGFRFGNPGPFDPGIGPACVLPCTGPRDRAHARHGAARQGAREGTRMPAGQLPYARLRDPAALRPEAQIFRIPRPL